MSVANNSKTTPLVSFIIAAYNAGTYIEEAVGSCLMQTYQNIEICVVDDGSQDDTFKKLSALNEKHDNLLIYSFNENRGKVAAFNKAFDMSKGKYIAIMGADDISVPDRVEFSLNHIGHYDLICGNLVKFSDEDGTILSADLMYDNFRIKQSKELTFNELLEKPVVYGGTIFAKKSALRRVFPVNENLRHEDWWIPLYLSYENSIKYFNKILLKYRTHPMQASAANKRFFDYSSWRYYFEKNAYYYEEILATFDLNEKNKKLIYFKMCREKLAVEKNIFMRIRLLRAIERKTIKDFLLVMHPIVFYFFGKLIFGQGGKS